LSFHTTWQTGGTCGLHYPFTVATRITGVSLKNLICFAFDHAIVSSRVLSMLWGRPGERIARGFSLQVEFFGNDAFAMGKNPRELTAIFNT
jgi:hypothetical protein